MSGPQQHPIPVVRAIIVDAERRVLVLRRPPGVAGSGGWCLPGGKVNFGETLDDAVRREVLEETGFNCLTTKFVICQDSLPLEGAGMHCLNLYFECSVSGSLHLNSESTECAWITRADLPRYDMVFRNDLGLLAYWTALGRL